MKTKNNLTTLSSKDIENILILAGWTNEAIIFANNYCKTPEEKEEVTNKIFDKARKLIGLYIKSPENQKKAILTEIRKLGEKQAVEELHEIFEINTPDNSNEMTFNSPYQYPEDGEKGDPQQ